MFMLGQCQIQKLSLIKVKIITTLLELNKLEKVVSDDNNEAMTKKDAAMFPIYLSAYLFGLYILFKVVDKNILQVLLTGFFSLMGV